MGMIHSTKNSRFEYFLGQMGRNRSKSSRPIPLAKGVSHSYKTVDPGSLLLVLESSDDNFGNSDIVKEDEDIIVFSATSCFMCRT